MAAQSEGASMAAQSAEARQVATQVSKWWWAWLVSGILWLIASVVILQFNSASVWLVGVIIGIMFLVSGLEQFAVAYLSEGWRWLWIIFGVILVIAGIAAIFEPYRTFVVIADIIGFVFVLVGIFWTVEAFATKDVNSLWWLGLIAGILMVIFGFAAAGKFLPGKEYLLLVFAGAWALVHGITDIIKAFQIRKIGRLVAQ
jgi:uncharacterized membrane protein HdeD (DUF308 family)